MKAVISVVDKEQFKQWSLHDWEVDNNGIDTLIINGVRFEWNNDTPYLEKLFFWGNWRNTNGSLIIYLAE